MALSFDAFSRPGAGTGVSGDQSWSHAGGTPKAVEVWIPVGTYAGSSSIINGVTYGGVAMTQATGSPLLKGTTEKLQVHLFRLLSSIPTGTQTVAIDTNAADTYSAGCVTWAGGNDSEIVDTDATISSDAQADPSVTLSLGGKTCACSIGFSSGQNAVTGITPFTNWTARSEEDIGGQSCGIYTYDIISTADVTAGWTQTSEDAAAIASAIAEIATGTSIPKFYNHYRKMWTESE